MPFWPDDQDQALFLTQGKPSWTHQCHTMNTIKMHHGKMFRMKLDTFFHFVLLAINGCAVRCDVSKHGPCETSPVSKLLRGETITAI